MYPGVSLAHEKNEKEKISPYQCVENSKKNTQDKKRGTRMHLRKGIHGN